ncbi:MAG: SpoIIE family protein phosphatase [Bacteroidales bacterium]|nr:SpoIIE family protein phosphatase [Bacteroidales bacterium]MBN2757318.1 SpoIIE family protein phosphatase [Bacteroidales bacterium]
MYYRKLSFLFTICLLSVNLAFSQSDFEFRGKLMVDKKIIKNAGVNVYCKSKLLLSSNTDEYGSFKLQIENKKKYVIKFKVDELPELSVMVYTNFDGEDKKMIKTKNQIFSLSSNSSKLEDSDVITAYQIDNNGMTESKSVVYEHEIFDNKKEIEIIKEIVNNDKIKVEDSISKLKGDEYKDLSSKFERLNLQIDSILEYTENQSDIIIKSSKREADKIISEAYYKLPEVIEKETKINMNTELPNKEVLDKFVVDEKKFYDREDIKKHKTEIEKLETIENKTAKENIEYMSAMVLVNEELVKSAKLQLKIDKLNAKTESDSIKLQQREVMIFLAEKEIGAAKDKIAYQQLEIKQKNTFLFFAITALIFFIVLFILVYNSFRIKKKTNAILEKQNIDIAHKNKKIIDSIRYAQTIQQAILPLKESIDKHFESFIIFQPKDIVSGDFYWFNHYESVNKSVFAVVDCTGHGVPGAFMSMIANRLLVEVVSEKEIFEPVQILEEVDKSLRNALMQDETSNNDGMDVGICVIEKIDDNNSKIEFAGAKRPLFYTENDLNEIKYIKGTVRGIGGRKRLRKKSKKEFEKHTLNLKKGEILYLTTDGFFDLQSPNRKKFGRINFMKILEENSKKSLQEQKDIIVDTLHLHKGSEFQIDDITIMGIKI